jgi:hypothetical protein
MKRINLGIITLGACLLAGGAALATGNLLVPINGTAFQSQSHSGNVVYLSNGAITNNGSQGGPQEIVIASLGHALGGSYGFRFYGTNRFATSPISCSVNAVSSANPNVGQTYVNSGSAAAGPFNFTITATPPAGDYFYSAFCNLPGGGVASLLGVLPLQ